jgi:hypothetical protein
MASSLAGLHRAQPPLHPIHILNLIILLLIVHAAPIASVRKDMSSSAYVAPRGATSGLDISL